MEAFPQGNECAIDIIMRGISSHTPTGTEIVA
jgi:hypothetical protein